MFHMPMSSPMMNRMLGFLSCACAAVTMNATHRATAHCFSIFGFIVCWLLLEKAGGPCEPPAGLSIRLFAFVLLHHRLDLLLHGIEVKRGRILHRRVVDGRLRELRDVLLD